MSRRGARARPRMLLTVVVSVAVVAFLFVGVFPTRAILAQRDATAAAAAELADIEAVNAELEARVAALGTDAEIERLAREQYSLVFPGEEAYAILPPPLPEVEIPDLWIFAWLRDPDSRG